MFAIRAIHLWIDLYKTVLIHLTDATNRLLRPQSLNHKIKCFKCNRSTYDAHLIISQQFRVFISRCPIWSSVYNEMHSHSSRNATRFTTLNRNRFILPIQPLCLCGRVLWHKFVTNIQWKNFDRRIYPRSIFISISFFSRLLNCWLFEQSNGLRWKRWMQKLGIETLFESEFCFWNYSLRIKYK